MPEHSLVLGPCLIPSPANGVIVERAKSERDLDGIRKAPAMSAASFQGVQNQINFVLFILMERDRGLFYASAARSFRLACRRRAIRRSSHQGARNFDGRRGWRRFHLRSPPLLMLWLSPLRFLLRCGRGFRCTEAGG